MLAFLGVVGVVVVVVFPSSRVCIGVCLQDWGQGMRWGIHKAHRGTAIPMATVCQVGGLGVQLPYRSLEMEKKRECEHKEGKRR